jgi:hypothetical protein
MIKKEQSMELELFSLYEKTCLEIFSDSIHKCHSLGSNKWGITVRTPRHYRLVMGNLVVATIESGAIWLALDIPSSREKAKLDEIMNWGWSPQYQYKPVPSVSGYYWPMEWEYSSHSKIWPILKKLHYRYLPKVADYYHQLRSLSQASHSNEAIKLIEKVLGTSLPRPNYLE